MKKTNKNTNMGMALGMCFGVSIGSALGTSMGNIGIGIPIGLCIGMLLGLVIGAQKDKEVNRQLEERSYTVKAIEAKDTEKEYVVTVVDKTGGESVICIPKGQMQAEKFEIGDVVFLDEDGMIEQAFDEE